MAKKLEPSFGLTLHFMEFLPIPRRNFPTNLMVLCCALGSKGDGPFGSWHYSKKGAKAPFFCYLEACYLIHQPEGFALPPHVIEEERFPWTSS